MIRRRLQFFLPLLLCTVACAELQPGSVARLSFHDVDGNDLSTADGHVTIITVLTRQNEEQAHAVADLVPERYVGDSGFRYVTLVNFQRKIARPFQGVTRLVIRQRLDSEAAKLRPEYRKKKIGHDPRRDTLVVADFDGAGVTELGLSPDANEIAVFVFNRRGKLMQRWNAVPPADAFAMAIAAAAAS